MPGDILQAKDAIEAIPAADLGPPIEIPEIPRMAAPENISLEERTFWKSEIVRLKQKRNAMIFAHNYVPPDVQDMADFVGDSLYLAQKGKGSGADVLVEASVLFMNQILAAMKKPEQKVLAPSLKALCSLAAHADVNKIRSWKSAHPSGQVISYVNTYIDVKAESDYCCASANAAKVIMHVLENHPKSPVLFLPDVHLGFYAAKLMQKTGEPLDRRCLMIAACHVHDSIRPYHVAEARKKYPAAAAVIHPECGCTGACMRTISEEAVLENMMQFRSTQGMIKFVKETSQKEIIVATEVGNIYPMQKAAPDKTLIPASREAVCAFMKQNTLENLYESLRDMKYEITLDPELARKALVPIERMLKIV